MDWIYEVMCGELDRWQAPVKGKSSFLTAIRDKQRRGWVRNDKFYLARGYQPAFIP